MPQRKPLTETIIPQANTSALAMIQMAAGSMGRLPQLWRDNPGSWPRLGGQAVAGQAGGLPCRN